MAERVVLFTVPDKDGIPVTMTVDTWLDKLLHPVIGHPEVAAYLEEIQRTIQAPEVVFRSARDERALVFQRSGLTRGKFAHCYVTVIVKYVMEAEGIHGYVSTVMLTRDLYRGGKLIWRHGKIGDRDFA